ncbi:MAG TPA: hypothetical protein VIY86_13430 [Pirellulaceae bacterium]
MEIAVTRTHFNEWRVIARMACRILLSLVALAIICFVAPGIYGSNAAVQDFQRATSTAYWLRGQRYTQIRDRHRAILAAVDSQPSRESRNAYVRRQLERARIELEGSLLNQQALQIQFNGVNTFMNRMVGSKFLALARDELREEANFVNLASGHVQRLTTLLESDPVVDDTPPTRMPAR